MTWQKRGRLAALPAIAAAGLLAGHRLTYLGLAPRPEANAAWLETTGHGYLGTLGITALALAIMGALFWVLLGSWQKPGLAPRAAGIYRTVSVIQLAGFGAQEVLERALVGAPMHDLAMVFVLGIPVQLVVAAVAALLAVGLYKAGEALAALLRPAHPRIPAAQAWPAGAVVLPPAGHHNGDRCTRGPPVTLLA